MVRKVSEAGRKRHRGQAHIAKAQAAKAKRRNKAREQYERMAFPTGYVGRPLKEDMLGTI